KNKTYNLQPDKFGYWKNTIHEVAPGDKYYFVIDGSSKKPDPSSRFQPEGVHGPGEVIDPHFAWNDQGWKGRPLKDMIVYELHTGTFTPGGTFEAITEKLDYLIDLGINTIE